MKIFFPGKLKSEESFYEIPFEKISDSQNSIEETSKVISNDEIVATCYGNIETGPRLGHRSLICNAHNNSLIKKLSTEIKNRSLFRPTAPAIFERKCRQILYFGKKFDEFVFSYGGCSHTKKGFC